MSKIVPRSFGRWAVAAAAGLLASPAFAAWTLNMTEGVTEISHSVHHLHMLILWICVVIAIVVFGAMIYSLVKFRKSQGAVAARWDHSTKTEIIWTVIPIAILVGMAVPAAETMIRVEDSRESEMSIKVTGYQWKWHYDYLDQKVAFFSTLARPDDAARQLKSGVDVHTLDNYLLNVDKPLVVPVDTKVRVLITGADVIHAWWVPAFGMKKDAIPGFINEIWFKAEQTGTYRGQCAELCGRDHAFMPVVVEVKSKEDYKTWLADQQKQATNAVAQNATDTVQTVAHATGETVAATTGSAE